MTSDTKCQLFISACDSLIAVSLVYIGFPLWVIPIAIIVTCYLNANWREREGLNK